MGMANERLGGVAWQLGNKEYRWLLTDQFCKFINKKCTARILTKSNRIAPVTINQYVAQSNRWKYALGRILQ